MAVSVRSLFHKNEKTPHGCVVEIATKEFPGLGIGISLPVFLPYDRAKIRELRDCMRENPVFMAEIAFQGFHLRKRQNGSHYAAADDFTIVKGD